MEFETVVLICIMRVQFTSNLNDICIFLQCNLERMVFKKKKHSISEIRNFYFKHKCIKEGVSTKILR